MFSSKDFQIFLWPFYAISSGYKGLPSKRAKALAKGDRGAAEEALKVAEPEIMRGVSKGVIHKNTGSRKVSRLTKRLAKLG